MSRRTERIGAQLQSEVARILRSEVMDPRVRFVTLTRIDVAPDLSHAVVYWSTSDTTAAETVQQGLESASTFVRRQVAQVLSLKRTPELRFRHDPSLELGSRTLAILRSLGDGEKT